MTDNPLLDDFMLWAPGSRAADDDRVRFTSISKGGNYVGLLFRDLQMDIADDGTGDWTVSHTEDGKTWSARSDSHTGAVLMLIAHRCGLEGELHTPGEEN